MSDELEREVLLACAVCGHAQALHCPRELEGHESCGCFGGPLRTGPDTIERTCECEGFFDPRLPGKAIE